VPDVALQLGRPILPSDDTASSQLVVIISDGFWETELRPILGRARPDGLKELPPLMENKSDEREDS
jgi:hypothetical protein